ncbi:peptidoglycan DD-metalloendopeptidase family protein [Halopseudomonas maritima]|uniref:peptidoglycan DD-metalloendopeptidase family protein n=1 Tax=Halopseudomonas maritima TaxID=2918528 RepID=UPI001EEAB3C3|nr:peptidoglycan DD-metalloendopeptidase family protein [Halopseudomonas maritima]
MGRCVREGCWAAERARGAAVVLLAAILAACAGPSGTVPIDDRGRGGQRAQSVTTGAHTVQRGETLYQIAFRYGWDWKELASRNNLRAPYTIYPGQRISLASGSSARARTPAPSTPARPAPVTSNPVVTSAPARSTPASTPSAPTTRAPASTASTTSSPTTAPVIAPGPVSAAGWSWPARGTLVARFQSNGSLNKGIDIAGQLGEPVKAAADGAVVYAGRGLIGYGDMIIIKHDETFLSAYAHNSRLLVKEGDQVKVGQVIAEMGSSGTDRVKLHFEIRRKGQPVDPLAYLPRS